MSANENAPHRAIVCISVEVHELMPTGEMGGKKPAFAVRPFVLALEGDNQADAIQKTQEFVNEVKQLCQTKSG